MTPSSSAPASPPLCRIAACSSTGPPTATAAVSPSTPASSTLGSAVPPEDIRPRTAPAMTSDAWLVREKSVALYLLSTGRLSDCDAVGVAIPASPVEVCSSSCTTPADTCLERETKPSLLPPGRLLLLMGLLPTSALSAPANCATSAVNSLWTELLLVDSIITLPTASSCRATSGTYRLRRTPRADVSASCSAPSLAGTDA
mmetsp:Transcript_635/g.1996  ORF Transcript_635/g.1996 Transcript_635/m.1996 type:complete len:201 (+) Transcript_635:1112-1714(+)